ncbi:chromatin modification- protein VID21, partial [Ceratobasidium sp. 392]
FFMGDASVGGQAPAPGTNAAPSSTGMELLRWQAVLQINPAHAFARRPTKCVTTHEWRVLRHELEYTRAMQRIEQLKLDGAWSFRQPKKQRGPVMSKTHWDYLMDEMKWLQVDFKEERRWKTVLAFELAHAVREWHATPAGSEERKAMCVGYIRPKDEEEDGDVETGVERDVVMNVDAETDGEQDGEEAEEAEDKEDKEGEEAIGPDGKVIETRSDAEGEDEDEDEEEEVVEQVAHTAGPEPREDVMGADEAGTEMPEIEESEKEKEKDETEVGVLTKEWAPAPKQEREQEDVAMTEGEEGEDGKDDNDADGEAEVDESMLPTPAVAEPAKEAEAEVGKPKEEEGGLPDPLEGALKEEADGKITLISTARTELLDLATTASLATTFSLPGPPSSPKAENETDKTIDDLAELFPELSLYTGLPTDLDPTDKRPDESMSSAAAGKLAHASRLFDVKPVLVGALEPARHLFKGKWVGLDEVPAVEDVKDVGAVRQDTVFDLFASERKQEDKQLRRRPDSGMTHPVAVQTPTKPRDAAARLERIHWTSEDDALLKSICDAYPNNWTLAADVFNSSRVTIKPDVRTAWDCYDRYGRVFGGGVPEPGAESSGSVGGGMQISLGGQGQAPRPGFPVEIALPSPGGTLNKKDNKGHVKRATPAFENRKQVRQHFLYDTLRKVVRKRENAAKANQPPKRTIPPPHETHSQIQSGQRIYTPAELSKLKAERDARHYAEMMKRRQEIYQQAVAAGRPVPRMPAGLVNIPQIRSAQMNVQQMQMQMQQQAQQQQASQPGSQQPTPGQQQSPVQQPAQAQPPTPQDAQIRRTQQQVNGHTPQTQSPNLRRPVPGTGNASPGIVNGQAMSHLLRTNGMHQMHMNLANGVIPPNMQQVGSNAMFVNGAAGMRGQLGPEQMNQLLLQQAARQISAQMQQNQQQQLQVPNVQPSTSDGDVMMQ